MADNQIPSSVADAVLVKSIEMPEGSQKVEELDFNKFKGRPITADDLLQGMKHMGFQASSMCEAVRIINEMVHHLFSSSSPPHIPPFSLNPPPETIMTNTVPSAPTATPLPKKKPPSSSATPPT